MTLTVILTVLSVILTVLKVIGIILAVLVGLILLIVLLVGFVPIRYKASGEYPAEGGQNEDVVSRRKRDALMNKVKASDEKEEDEYGEEKKGIPVKVNAVVSWLLHIVHVTVDFDSTGLIMTARLFGIFKIYSNDPETVKKKEEKRKKKEEKQRKKEEKKLSEEKEDVLQSETDDKVTDDKVTDTEEKSENDIEGSALSDSKNSEDKDDKADSSDNKSEASSDELDDDINFDEEETSDEYKGIKGKFKKIADKIKGIKDKINSLRKKKDYIMDMKDDPRVISGISYGKNKLILIIKRIFPKKLEGRVAFGMEDPSTTGKILAGAGIFYPVWGGHFDVEPDFEEKKLEVDASLKGRIILAMLVIPAIKIWFNKDIKYIRRKVGGFKKL